MIISWKDTKREEGVSGVAADIYGTYVLFDEYQVPDAYRSTEAVCLNIISYGMKPDGYEIYRRNAGNKKFTLLAVTKKSVSSMTYTDKKVTCAESYEYKVRSYKTIAKRDRPANTAVLSRCQLQIKQENIGYSLCRNRQIQRVKQFL